MNWNTVKTGVAIILCACAQSAWAQVSADEEQTLAQQGQAALQAGRYADAERAYERLEKLEPGMAEIHVTLGVLYFKEGKFDRAAPELRRALELKPNLPRVDSLLAMVLSEQGQFQQAIPGLERGFRQTSDSELRRMCGLRLERAHTSMHNNAKAIETALELQHAYPEDPEVLYYSSKVFGNEAFLAAQKLFETAPNSIWGLLAAGEAHESQGDTDEAVKDYREVLKLDLAKPNIHFRIGRALLARGAGSSDPKSSADAMAEFQQELEVDPSNANAAYELAEINRKQGQEEEARKYFQQAIDHYPNFEEAHVGLAATVLQNDPSLARTHLEKALVLDPEDSVAWYRLAQAERALGHSDEQKHALAEFERLRNHKPLVGLGASGLEVTPQQLDSVSTPARKE